MKIQHSIKYGRKENVCTRVFATLCSTLQCLKSAQHCACHKEIPYPTGERKKASKIDADGSTANTIKKATYE